jgi:hypothetical protein
MIGTEAVARAAPDGNTLLIHTGAFLSTPHLRKVNYDPFTSFEPICHLANQPTLRSPAHPAGAPPLIVLFVATRTYGTRTLDIGSTLEHFINATAAGRLQPLLPTPHHRGAVLNRRNRPMRATFFKT